MMYFLGMFDFSYFDNSFSLGLTASFRKSMDSYSYRFGDHKSGLLKAWFGSWLTNLLSRLTNQDLRVRSLKIQIRGFDFRPELPKSRPFFMNPMNPPHTFSTYILSSTQYKDFLAKKVTLLPIKSCVLLKEFFFFFLFLFTSK